MYPTLISWIIRRIVAQATSKATSKYGENAAKKAAQGKELEGLPPELAKKLTANAEKVAKGYVATGVGMFYGMFMIPLGLSIGGVGGAIIILIFLGVIAWGISSVKSGKLELSKLESEVVEYYSKT